MKRLLPILMVFGVFLGSAGESFALTDCVGSPTSTSSIIIKWMDCHGIYITPDRLKYVGEWKDGKPNGQGTLTSAVRGKYVGEWKDGKAHGKGTLTSFGGSKYVGKFRNDEFHGRGTYTFSDGKVKKGRWENGKYLGK